MSDFHSSENMNTINQHQPEANKLQPVNEPITISSDEEPNPENIPDKLYLFDMPLSPDKISISPPSPPLPKRIRRRSKRSPTFNLTKLKNYPAPSIRVNCGKRITLRDF